MADKTPDAELLRALQKGKNSAFREVYQKYFAMARYLVTQNSGTETEANDLFQDALVAFYEKVRQPDFELSATIKTYLYSICRNLWLKKLRDTKPTARLTDFENYIEVDEGPTEDFTERQLEITQRCMEELGDPCKTLLSMFYYFKNSMEEIATELGYSSPGTAKNQKYKCLQRLRKLALQKVGDAWS